MCVMNECISTSLEAEQQGNLDLCQHYQQYVKHVQEMIQKNLDLVIAQMVQVIINMFLSLPNLSQERLEFLLIIKSPSHLYLVYKSQTLWLAVSGELISPVQSRSDISMLESMHQISLYLYQSYGSFQLWVEQWHVSGSF